ncbi:copper resistance protein CopC [Blastococcus sp. CT_GayMR16]|uniref:copper resistance CopC/CopD family protein n=1 Tax=Blastococcus sp. CT_GayMR16 TaxID=2559607 RepID=UPI001074498D|nr:copper resistance protein CopC [Blastococcus sp. CT_GayMR16]TFV89829.1 copper resistance protein CopC [Blastococcus sp. CT_GayMR16]
MRRAPLLLLTLLAGWLLAGVVTAGPALAHATLISTDPGESARVDQVPAAVTLEFSEGVSLGAGYARVLGSDGERVDAGTASVGGGVLTIPLRSGLPDDGYLVTYRVISADSHPISGAYSFVVGDGELVPTSAAGTEDPTDPVVAVALPLFRWLGFAGVALAVGVPVLALLCWPGGWASDRLRRPAIWGAVAVAVGALGSFLFQGPYAAATGPGSLLDPSLLRATAAAGAGWALLARFVLALALAGVLLSVWRRGTAPSAGRVVLGGALAAGLVISTAAIGHPVAGPWPWLAVAVTVVHVAAMAVWLGGLAGLFLAVLRPEVPAGEVAAVVPRYSRIAFGAVAALVVSGTVQAVREVESPTALFVTAYGWLLVAKLVLVAVVLAAAGISRVWVQQRLGVRRSRRGGSRSLTAHAFAATADPNGSVQTAADVRGQTQSDSAAEHVPALRRSVLVELAVAAAVLALSATLVGLPPARAAVAQPVDALLPLQSATGPSGSVQVSVDPARPGGNTLHVYLFDDTGRLTQPADITVSLTEASQQIGPLDVELSPAGPGHYVSDAMDIPGAGTWTLAVSVRLDEFTATTASTDFPVR